MAPSRIHNHVRVLMLGWEYPPRFAGGLGKACQGLAQGMARQGAKVFFVLPTFPTRVSERHLEVVGARECIQAIGLDPETIVSYSTQAQTVPGTSGEISIIQSSARLAAYGAAPEGPIPERVLRTFEASSTTTFRTTTRVPSAPGKRTTYLRAVESGLPAQPQPGPSAERPKSSDIYGKNLWSEIERFTASVRHLAESHDVDVVHAHDWMTFPAAFEFSRLTGAPVFLHVHATEFDRSGDHLNNEVFKIEQEGFRRARHIFAVSRYTAGILERLYGISRKKITVIYNAPEETYKHLETGATAEKREPQVVFLGRLTFQKGPDHFLRAAQIVSEAMREARFVFCGTGDMLEKLRGQAYQLGIEDRVHFAGFVDPSKVDEILRVSKVLVMPSVSEPFGLVALEAIHCGLPTIISKQSGVREVLHRALQVDFWDHEKLADQILAALRLPDLSGQLVTEGMEQVRQLSWEKSAQKVIEAYHRYGGSTYAQAVEGAHGH